MANSTDISVSYQIWLAQCAQAKPDALRQLYQHEAPHLLALGTSLLLRSTDAEELVRESFELIWLNAEGYEPTLGSARGWIYGVFRFKAQQRLKQKTTSNSFVKAKSRLIIPSNAPPELLQFQALDEKSRHVLALAYLHAYSYAEIAKVCQSTIKKTQEDLHKALEKLVQLSSAWKNQSSSELCLLGMYCLGLLREPHTVAPAQALLGTNPNASYDLLLWEDILSALTHTLAKPAVSPTLWLRICQDLELDLALPIAPPAPIKLESEPKLRPEPTPEPESEQKQKQKLKTKAKIQSQKKAYWATSIVAALALIGLTAFALKPSPPVIQRIEMSPRAGAILQSPGQSSTPGWIVTVDPKGNVLLSPQVNTELKTNEVVQLWTQSPNNPTIRSLGLLNPNKPVTVPYEMIGETQVGQIFEMTLEPPKGSSTPTGAVLFIGKLVNFGEFSEPN